MKLRKTRDTMIIRGFALPSVGLGSGCAFWIWPTDGRADPRMTIVASLVSSGSGLQTAAVLRGSDGAGAYAIVAIAFWMQVSNLIGLVQVTFRLIGIELVLCVDHLAC